MRQQKRTTTTTHVFLPLLSQRWIRSSFFVFVCGQGLRLAGSAHKYFTDCCFLCVVRIHTHLKRVKNSNDNDNDNDKKKIGRRRSRTALAVRTGSCGEGNLSSSVDTIIKAEQRRRPSLKERTRLWMWRK